ncbi:MAG: hypothetical protein ACYTDY_13750, partial [Planctomycetota bacterium]
RRFIFLGVAICTTLPFFLPMGLPVYVTRYTQLVFDEVDKVQSADDPDAKPILLALDYDPGTLAELHPMAHAVLRHIFARKGKVIVLSFLPTGAGLAEETLRRVAGEFPDAKEGVHYAYLGFNVPAGAVMQSIGRDIRDNYPTDTRGVKLDDMPLFEGVANYDDILIVIDLAGNNYPEYWIQNAVERFGARFAMGVTNVMAADFTPYIPQQAKGIITGLRGAAEYERLIVDHGYWPKVGDGARGMDPQSITHLFIIVVIALGNVGYFLSRKKRRAVR